MDYKAKLIKFNSTEKYKKEYKFLKSLIGSKPKTVLDYGCGIGSNVDKLNAFTEHMVFGYDATKWNDDFTYIDSMGEYDVVYFMHSIAHVQYVETLLSRIKLKNLNKGGKVIVITPNADWLKLNENPEYIPDPTVFRHYNMETLSQLFNDCGYSIEMVGQFGQVTKGINERVFLIAK